jgi:hypothetical protein
MLFETMERLLDDDDDKMDLDRAETISKVAHTVINTATVEVDFMRQTGFGGSEFLQGEAPAARRLKAVEPPKPGIEVTAETPKEELCLNCTLPECNESSDHCLVKIQRRAA